MQNAGGWGDMFAIAAHNWTWLSAAMGLGFLVGWATYKRSGAE